MILTNDHIASGADGQPGFWGKWDRAARVRLRFDCEYTAEGKITDGKEYKLAADYQILRSPVEQLDYALLKIDSSMGRPSDDIVGGKPRGFVIPIAHAFEESEPLLILQHPQAEPMKLAFGSLTPKSLWTPSHIAYFVNTGGGSSGSPCMTQNLAVAALHHWGSEAHNRGVLISAILSDWNNPKNRGRLIAVGLGHLIGEEQSVGSVVQVPATAPSPTPILNRASVDLPVGSPASSDGRHESREKVYRTALRLSATGLDWWERAIPIYATLGSGSTSPLARKALRDWVDGDRQHCVILGNPGSGKSGLLRWLASELANRDDTLPLVVAAAKLRRLSDVTLYALGELAEPQIEPTLYTEKLGSKQLLILLDGLDELVGAETGGDAIARKLLGHLFGVVPPATRVVAACRTPAFSVLGESLTEALPVRPASSGTGDAYDVAIARALDLTGPLLVARLLPVLDADAAAFLHTTRLSRKLVDDTVSQPSIRPFLASPFSIRMLSLALPHLAGSGPVSIVDLYRIYIKAALTREKQDLSQRELNAIISSLRDLAVDPSRRVDPDGSRLARNAGLLTRSGGRDEFTHYTLWEYLFSSRVHEQMTNYDSQLLSRLDLVRGYNLNRFLVPMMLSLLSSNPQLAEPLLRVVRPTEYKDFLRHRRWRADTGYGIHPSITVAHDGTPSATFGFDWKEVWSIHKSASHGTQVTSGVSWYDASVFALHAGALLPSMDQLRTLQADGDYLFWGSQWCNEEISHMCALEAKTGRIVGINPDVRLPRTALAVYG